MGKVVELFTGREAPARISIAERLVDLIAQAVTEEDDFAADTLTRAWTLIEFRGSGLIPQGGL